MDYRPLIQAAILARENAYCPYSGFAVGAALLAEDGRIFSGCNIESASYSPTNCAERTALFSAVSAGNRNFTALAVVGAKTTDAMPFSTCYPCGVCLQAIREFCPPEFPILLANSAEEYSVKTLGELLPFGFVLDRKEHSADEDV